MLKLIIILNIVNFFFLLNHLLGFLDWFLLLRLLLLLLLRFRLLRFGLLGFWLFD
jgi:hypothetical protein